MKIALIGYGKMGREIERILVERGHSIALIVDRDNTDDLTPENLHGVDAAIEFTTPSTAFDNLRICFEAGVPVVCGTTGWTERLHEAEALCRQHGGAFFHPSNNTIGLNVLFEVKRKLAEQMNRFGAYDVTVEETHHTQKKDAPSGTAITLAGDILDRIDRKTHWTSGTTTEPDALEIASVRRSVVPGIHTVTYESEADVLSITHCAKNRCGFATGAVMAAEFVAGKKGIFSMKDLLGLE